jgi:polysaccharide pyruvyl transferase WcaK-like protein
LIVGRVDSVVFGGGSVFHAEDDLRRFTTWLRRVRPGPRMAAGVSIGPFKTAAAEEACARMLPGMTFVGVRDSASLERVRALAPTVRSELTFDIAPLLLTHVEACEPARPSGRILAISLCALRSDPVAPPWFQELILSLQRLARRGLFERLSLVDFNAESLDAGRSDSSLHAALARALGDHVPIEHVPYAGDPAATARTLGAASAVLAMRLHAAVFAYALDRPCAVIRYHEKSAEWCREIGLSPSLSVDRSDASAGVFERMLDAVLATSPPRPQLSLESALARSLRNWTWLTE